MKKMRKNGQVIMYIVFFIMSIFIIILGAIIAPMGTLFSTEAYAAGDRILAQANESTSKILDADVQAAYQASIASARESSTTNVEITTNMYQYSWAFVLILTGLVIFMITRSLVEYGQRYGGFI